MAHRFEAGRRVLVGHGNTEGSICRFDYDADAGALMPAGKFDSGSSTSFLAVHPDGRHLYTTQNRSNQLSALEWADAEDGGDNSASAGLRLLNRVDVPAAPGESASGPAYTTVDGGGRFVLCANYRGHNAVVFALQADGRLGQLVCNVADGKHAHLIRLTPDNRHALVPFLGSDRVGQYRFDAASGRLTPNDPPALALPAGSGPRHLEFHPGGRFVYLIGELDAHLYTLSLDARAGTLSARGRLDTLPPGYQGRRWGAHLQCSPDGRFLYVSNRAHDSLAVFALDADTGMPTLRQQLASGGKTPRHFSLSPDGRFLLVPHQDSANLVTFAVDSATGRLQPHQERRVAESPYYINFV